MIIQFNLKPQKYFTVVLFYVLIRRNIITNITFMMITTNITKTRQEYDNHMFGTNTINMFYID